MKSTEEYSKRPDIEELAEESLGAVAGGTADIEELLRAMEESGSCLNPEDMAVNNMISPAMPEPNTLAPQEEEIEKINEELSYNYPVSSKRADIYNKMYGM